MLRNRRVYAVLRPLIKFIKFRILHVDDSPHRLALGVAVGLFVGWTPTIGLQMLISLLLSFVLKANKFLSVTLVWVSNIFTFIAIYFPSYLIGKYTLSLFGIDDGLTKTQVFEMLKRLSSFRVIIDMWSSSFWVDLFEIFFNIGKSLWVGSVIIGLLVAVIGYFLTYKMIVWHRTKYTHRPRHRKKLFRKRKKAIKN